MAMAGPMPVMSMIPTSPSLYMAPGGGGMPVAVPSTTGSYVPAPAMHQMMAAPSYMPTSAAVSYVPGPAPHYTQGHAPEAYAASGPPPSLTEGIPDPDAIEQQRRAYERGLDSEFESTKKIAAEQIKQQKSALKSQADQQLSLYKAQLDAALKQQEMGLEQKHQQHMMELQQAFMKQKAALEQQATSLTMEYNQRKMQEDLMIKQAEMQREMVDMQKRMAQEMQAHQDQHFRMQQEHVEQRNAHETEIRAQQAELYRSHGAMQDGLVRSTGQVPVYTAPAQPQYVTSGHVHQPMVYQAAPSYMMSAAPGYASAAPGYAVSTYLSMQQLPEQPLIMEPQTVSAVSVHEHVTTCGNCGDIFLPDAAFCRRCGLKREQTARYSYAPISAQYAQPMLHHLES